MATLVYILSAVTSGLCALLLLRGYSTSRVRLLLWSGLCFVFFTLSNVLLFIDLQVIPDVDLSLLRSIPNLLGVSFLLYGFIWDAK